VERDCGPDGAGHPPRAPRGQPGVVHRHLQLGQRLTDDRAGDVEKQLEAVLTDARAATRDVTAMREQLINVILRMRRTAASCYPEEEIDEVADLLTWLLRDNFVFLGYREYALVDTDAGPAAQVVPGSGRGILSQEDKSAYAQPVPLSEIPPGLRERMVSGELLTVSRTNRRSTVHRQSRMVYLGVKTVGSDGTIVGEQRFLGLFARSAYAEPASTIPVLRRKLVQLLDAEDIVEDSHDERMLRALFDAFPKHELFGASAEELRGVLIPLLHTQERREVRLLCRTDPNGRGVSALVSLPRERFSSTIREKVQAFLADRFGTDSMDYHLSMTEGGQALLHFMLHVDSDEMEDIAYDELERDVVELTRTWDDALRDAIADTLGGAAGRQLAERWDGRFPPPYRAVVAPGDAVGDVRELTALVDGEASIRMSLQKASDRSAGPFRLKFYKTGQGVELSSFLPILESLGFVVVEEVPYALEAVGTDGVTVPVHVHDFGVRIDQEIVAATSAADGLDIAADGDRLAAAAQAIWRRPRRGGLPEPPRAARRPAWYDVALLRAYRRYRRQVGTSFTEAYQNAALLAHPDVARALVELFAARFDPDLNADPEVEAARRAGGRSPGRGRAARLRPHPRRYLGAIDATVRTNRYIVRRGGRGSSALAFKLDSRLVPEIPKPVPHSETFVYSPELEGVHLRGGPVAAGASAGAPGRRTCAPRCSAS
jgi:glutamate dehydrogenase